MKKVSNTNAPVTEPIATELARSRKLIHQFISSCSSSMRTPVNTIGQMAGLLTCMESAEEKSVVTQVIKQQAEQVESMLDELQLFMSSIERRVA